MTYTPPSETAGARVKLFFLLAGALTACVLCLVGLSGVGYILGGTIGGYVGAFAFLLILLAVCVALDT